MCCECDDDDDNNAKNLGQHSRTLLSQIKYMRCIKVYKMLSLDVWLRVCFVLLSVGIVDLTLTHF